MKQQDFLHIETISTPQKEVIIRALIDKNTSLNTQVSGLKEEITDLRQQLAMYKKLVHGQKSEKTEVILGDGEQMSLFDEAEATAAKSPEDVKHVVAEHTRKPKRTHDEMAADLPVEEVVHQVDDRNCDKCDAEMNTVGREFIRDELVYVPARLFVRKHYAEVLKCTECGSDESRDAAFADIEACNFKKAVVPKPLIAHSFCSVELLAHIIYEKYCNALPLYRQEKDLAAKGVKLSRATMANWVIHAAKTWISPIWSRMKAELMSQPVVHADETVVQVLNEPGRKAKTASRMWVYCSGKAGGHANILFEYRPTRSGDYPARFLDGFKGYLVCDGYDGYNKVKLVTRCGCWAHVRRKFVEALPTDKELLSTSSAAVGVEWCNKIFDLEREFENLAPWERHKQRQERSKPVLDGFYAWLDTLNPSGGTKLAKAFSYARSERRYLYSFLESPDVPVDNNRAENAVRPFVIGRKNWLFSDSVKGAEASAMIYSVAATACANGLNVERYFTKLFLAGNIAGNIENHMPW